MASIHFSVLNPDRHKSMLFLLTAVSFSGTLAGTFFFLPGISAIALFNIGFWRLFAIALSFLLGIFVFGFCRFGRFLIPLVLAVFSALVSASFRTLVGTVAKIWSMEFLVAAVLSLIMFSAVFFLCTQACIVSKHFPIQFSRHTRFAKPQRALYVFEYIFLNAVMAACFAGLHFFAQGLV